jgi:hypothetical protein
VVDVTLVVVVVRAIVVVVAGDVVVGGVVVGVVVVVGVIVVVVVAFVVVLVVGMIVVDVPSRVVDVTDGGGPGRSRRRVLTERTSRATAFAIELADSAVAGGGL